MKMLDKETLPSSSYVTKHKFQDVCDKKFRALSIIHLLYELFSVIWGIFAWFCQMLSSPDCKAIELRTNVVDKMDKLTLLQLNHIKLKGSYKNFPRGLRWLCMHGFRLKYIPSELPMENLVALDMSYRDLEQVWKNPMPLGSLKILNLSHCIKLARVSGFSGLPSLERLILAGCVSLNHISESIGYECAELEILDMSDCYKLRRLPRSIGKLKKVRILSISGCFGVDEFPIEMKDMESLKLLKAGNIGLKYHASLSSFTKLIPKIPKLVSHSFPSSLVILSLKDNNLSNESFPLDFSSMVMLKELYLDNNPIDSLPTFVRSLRMLEELSVEECSMLKSLLCLPRTLLRLSIKKCSSLMKITFHEEMLKIPYIEYTGVESLEEIPGIIKIQDLAQVDEKILSAVGWANLHYRKDQELDLETPIMWFQKKKPVQMIYAFGIFSTCFVGKEVPDWLEGYKSSNGSSRIYFMMPSTPANKRFQGFNIAFVHALEPGTFLSLKIVNKTKNLSWDYFGAFSVHGKDDETEMVVWLSHWMFGNNEFEDGDEANLEIDQYDSSHVKEFAISPVYGDISSDMEDEAEDPLAYYKSYSWKYRIGGDLSGFQFAPGYYCVNYFLIFLNQEEGNLFSN